MPLYEFQCTNGHVFEEIVKSDVRNLNCPECQTGSERLISAPYIDWRRMGLDPGFPTAYDKWAKMQEEKAKKEDSQNLVHY